MNIDAQISGPHFQLSEVPPASPLLRDGTSGHMFERMCAAELFQGPIMLIAALASVPYGIVLY